MYRAESRRDVFAFTTRAAGPARAPPLEFNYAPAVINFFPRLRGNTQFQDTFAVIELRHHAGAPRNVPSLSLILLFCLAFSFSLSLFLFT